MKYIKLSLQIISNVIIGWLLSLLKMINLCYSYSKYRKKLKNDNKIYTRCQTIPSTVYKRPDPMIYSQRYLISKGLAVTWDNPDIQLFKGGIPVSSNELLLDTDYEIQATIYNGSNEAPAVNMSIDFSYLTFGVGTQSIKIGSSIVDLPVRGAPGHPVKTSTVWRTPNIAGHYCIEVKLNWADDANPHNNIGQENTNVGVFHSPAIFEFPVRNELEGLYTFILAADTYTIPNRIDCNDVINGRIVGDKSLKNLCDLFQERHKKGNFPIPPNWKVEISPNPFSLKPKEQQIVKTTITPPDDFSGTQAFNINVFATHENTLEDFRLLGGITLYTQR